MSLLNKNYGINQAVRITAHKNLSLIGRTGVTIGKNSEYSYRGQSDSYIVLLDVPLDWPSVIVSDLYLEKINKE